MLESPNTQGVFFHDESTYSDSPHDCISVLLIISALTSSSVSKKAVIHSLKPGVLKQHTAASYKRHFCQWVKNHLQNFAPCSWKSFQVVLLPKIEIRKSNQTDFK